MMIPEEQLHAAMAWLTNPGGDPEVSIEIERIGDESGMFATVRNGVVFIRINMTTGWLTFGIGSHHLELSPSVHNAGLVRDLATVTADPRTQKVVALSSSIAASNQNRTT